MQQNNGIINYKNQYEEDNEELDIRHETRVYSPNERYRLALYNTI